MSRLLSSFRPARAGGVALLAIALGLAAAPASRADTMVVDDATVLALEYGGGIRPDPALVETIDAELALIRAQLPILSAIHVLPAWIPGDVLVRMTDEALDALRDGTFTGFDAIFDEYPLLEMRIFNVIPWVSITFVEPLHPLYLAPLFLAVDGVTLVEANHVAGDGDDITIHQPGSYTFKHGWGDCPAGCIHAHYWLVEIQDGQAVVIEEWGDDLVAVEHRCWSEIRDLYR